MAKITTIEAVDSFPEGGVFRWAENAFRVQRILDPNLAGQELFRIRQKYKQLTPEAVVNEARKKDNPLHDYFIWDDRKAAEEFRKEQAREIIRFLRIEVPGGKKPQRVFFHIHEEKVPQYQAKEVIWKKDEIYTQVVLECYGMLQGWFDRWEEILDRIPGFRKEVKRFTKFLDNVLKKKPWESKKDRKKRR